jgi:hypothetical protein
VATGRWLMTVHVGEILTDVVLAAAAAPTERPPTPPPRLGAAQEAWRQLAWEIKRDCCRTAAEGFDD